MADQLLVNIVAVTALGGGGSVTLPHGLRVRGQGVTPTQVLCDRATPLTVGAVTATSITVTNPTSSPLSANFRCEFDHSIHAVGAALTKWQGASGVLAFGSPAGGDLDGTYPNPTVDGFAGKPIDTSAPAANDYWQFDGTTWRHVAVTPGTPAAIWGQFSDSANQNLSGTPLDIRYNTVEGSAGGITIANDPVSGRASRITVASAGVYAFTISPQLVHNAGGGAELVGFYAVTDTGTIPRSASYTELGNNNRGTLPYLELIVPMTAGGWLQWWFSSNPGSNIALEAIPAAGSVPAAPSVIAGVKLIGV